MRAIGGLLLVVAALTGIVGAAWTLLDAVGTEWDYCRGSSCTSGWAIGLALLAGAGLAGVAGIALLRRNSRRILREPG